MQHKQYALFDSAISAFLRPFVCQTDADAVRLFSTWVNDDKAETNVHKYPHQFTLYYLGEFNDQLGLFNVDVDGNKQDIKPREIMLGINVQEEEHKKFSIKQLLGMFEHHMKEQEDNIVNIGEAK
jgi:hypothetical protein